jgi:YidC/Oxa1 family membrane protein insertase
MSLFAAFDAAVGVAHSTIESLAALLTPIAGGTAAAVAIVLFTVAVRLLISPLSYLQIRGERRRAALAPRLADLQRKHRDDPASLASETLALYRANGASPLAGLLPGLAQAPFFMIMYRVALEAPAGSFLGVPLSAHVFAGLPAFAVLLAIAIVLAWLSSRRIRRTAATSAAPTSAPAKPPAPTNPLAGAVPTRPPGTTPILDLWLPFRRSTPDLRQPQLQDRGKRGRTGRGKEGRPGSREEGAAGSREGGAAGSREGGAAGSRGAEAAGRPRARGLDAVVAVRRCSRGGLAPARWCPLPRDVHGVDRSGAFHRVPSLHRQFLASCGPSLTSPSLTAGRQDPPARASIMRMGLPGSHSGPSTATAAAPAAGGIQLQRHSPERAADRRPQEDTRDLGVVVVSIQLWVGRGECLLGGGAG